jgi:hypothetical protein
MECCMPKSSVKLTGQSQKSYNRKQLIEKRRRAFWRNVPHVCANCKENDPVLIDFHHPGEKHYSVALLLNKALYAPRSHWPRLLIEELSRTIPLCVSCHRYLHRGYIKLYDTTTLVVERGENEIFT